MLEQKMTVINIPIDSIDTTGQMIRAGIDDDHVIELSNSIAKLGLLEPIVVKEVDKDRYQLIAGYHRLLACKRLNWNTIPAHIREDTEGSPRKGLALVENIIRKNMSLAEECEAVRILTEEENMSISQVCQLLGRSREWVLKRLTLPNLPHPVREALFEGLIGINVAEKIAEIQDESAIGYILNEAIYGKRTFYEVSNMVELYKAVPDIQEAVKKGEKASEQKEAKGHPTRPCDIKGEICKISEMVVIWACKSCARDIEALRMIVTEAQEEEE